MFKFNGGHGAIVCDKCYAIIKTGLSPEEYRKISLGKDLCWRCREASSRSV